MTNIKNAIKTLDTEQLRELLRNLKPENALSLEERRSLIATFQEERQRRITAFQALPKLVAPRIAQQRQIADIHTLLIEHGIYAIGQ